MSNLLGKRIGHFRVVELLGRGGMGEVYVGYDETLERRVALKSIRAEHRLNADAKTRFLREARVLSKLRHPNICQIFDYIEGDDADFLVLELIRGRNLAAAIKAGLDEKEKLRIVEQIARVLMAAHENNIVHRDLKPDNVMLTEEGEVKVLDFGISRLHTDQKTLTLELNAAVAAVLAQTGSNGAAGQSGGDAGTISLAAGDDATLQLGSDQATADSVGTLAVAPEEIGTLAAAPEQVETLNVGAEQIGTLNLSGDGEPDLRPGDVADRPAHPVAMTVAGAIMGTLGYMSPEQARGEVAGPGSDMYSLGIMMQELFTGRYAFERGLSAHELLRKSAAGETLPVAGIDADIASLINRLKSLAPAARPTAIDTVERIRWIVEKPKRARRRFMATAAIVVLALFGVFMTIQTIRATRAERAAQREAEVARNVSDFLVDLFAVSDPYDKRSGETVTARELLDKGAAKVDADLRNQPAVQARLMGTIGRVYRKLGLLNDAQRPLESALSIGEKASGAESAEVAECLFNLASLYTDQGRYAEAEPLFKRSLALREKRFGPNDPLVAEVLNNLASLYANQGKFEPAEPLVRRAVAIREKALGPEAPLVADGLNNLAALASVQGRIAEAEALYKRSLAIREKVFGPNHPRVADSLNNLAADLIEHGKYDDAAPLSQRSIAIYEKALGPKHPSTADAINNLAEIRHLQKRYGEATELYAKSLAILEQVYGREHPSVAYELNYLGKVYLDQDKLAESEQYLRRADAVYEKAVGLDHPDTAHTLFNLACLEAKKGRAAEAIDLLRRAAPASAGMPWTESIDNEPAFDSLRSNPEFLKVVAAMKSAA